jgi:DNA-binding transcriptional LysR family regulator
MRVEQLEYVTAVARLGSFRRAAEELHISQPALSETVRKLEGELGVEILERRRGGTRISPAGRDLLPHMLDAIEAVGRMRRIAAAESVEVGTVRVGTVTAATAPLLTPTIGEFGERHPATHVEVVTAQQERIHAALLDGSLDLGLVNYLEDEALPAEFEATELVRGRPVVCVRADSALAAQSAVRVADLRREALIAMRPGYVMHRYLQRLFGDAEPSFSYSADGAEMGKLMVSAGLGAAVLPDYSVAGDPLEVRGEIVYRPIEDDDTSVMLVVQRRHSVSPSAAVSELHQLFVDNADRVWAAPA